MPDNLENVPQIENNPDLAVEAEEAQKASEYPRVEGDFLVLGPEIFTKVSDQSVISWRGVNYVLPKPVDEHPTILSYEEGTAVEVLKDGTWIEGMVNSKEKRLKLLYVHTSRGPITIARADGIRPL